MPKKRVVDNGAFPRRMDGEDNQGYAPVQGFHPDRNPLGLREEHAPSAEEEFFLAQEKAIIEDDEAGKKVVMSFIADIENHPDPLEEAGEKIRKELNEALLGKGPVISEGFGPSIKEDMEMEEAEEKKADERKKEEPEPEPCLCGAHCSCERQPVSPVLYAIPLSAAKKRQEKMEEAGIKVSDRNEKWRKEKAESRKPKEDRRAAKLDSVRLRRTRMADIIPSADS